MMMASTSIMEVIWMWFPSYFCWLQLGEICSYPCNHKCFGQCVVGIIVQPLSRIPYLGLLRARTKCRHLIYAQKIQSEVGMLLRPGW